MHFIVTSVALVVIYLTTVPAAPHSAKDKNSVATDLVVCFWTPLTVLLWLLLIAATISLQLLSFLCIPLLFIIPTDSVWVSSILASRRVECCVALPPKMRQRSTAVSNLWNIDKIFRVVVAVMKRFLQLAFCSAVLCGMRVNRKNYLSCRLRVIVMFYGSQFSEWDVLLFCENYNERKCQKDFFVVIKFKNL